MGGYINKIIEGDLQAFDDLYIKYKLPVMAILRGKFGVSGDDLLDLWHSAAVTLLQNCRSGKVAEDGIPDSNIRAYLVSTAKNTFLAGKRKEERMGFKLPLDDPDQFTTAEKKINESVDVADPYFEEKIEIVRSAVREMTSPCDELLKMRHFENRSSEFIAHQMGYANGDVAKNMVGRCMKKLKTYVMGLFKEKELI